MPSISLPTSAKEVTALVEETYQKTPPETWSVLAGTFAFGTTLCLSTWTQQRILHISTGTAAPVPSLVGFLTVCAASVVAHEAAIQAFKLVHPKVTYQILGQEIPTKPLDVIKQNPVFQTVQGLWQRPITMDEVKRKANRLLFLNKSRDQDFIDLKVFHLSLHTVRICVVGLLAFKVLGGRFWAIAPSSYTHLGSFARRSYSLPATESYASSAKRAMLEKLGRIVGCHTCGSRRILSFGQKVLPSSSLSSRSFHFVGDHMPPKSVAEQINKRFHRRLLRLGNVKFRFYPQCVDCSGKQGGLLATATQKLRIHKSSLGSWLTGGAPSLAKAGGGANSYFHGLTPRWNHLAGGVLGALAVTDATPYDILQNNNRRRYRQYQKNIQIWLRRKQSKWLGTRPPSWEW